MAEEGTAQNAGAPWNDLPDPLPLETPAIYDEIRVRAGERITVETIRAATEEMRRAQEAQRQDTVLVGATTGRTIETYTETENRRRAEFAAAQLRRREQPPPYGFIPPWAADTELRKLYHTWKRTNRGTPFNNINNLPTQELLDMLNFFFLHCVPRAAFEDAQAEIKSLRELLERIRKSRGTQNPG